MSGKSVATFEISMIRKLKLCTKGCSSVLANHEACQYLLDKGADINYADEFGRTAFHAALANKDIVNYPYEAYEDRAPEAWHADKRYFRDTIGTLQKYDYYYYR